MRVAIRKWGNSLALLIPRSVVAHSRIREGTVVEVSLNEGKLVATPMTDELTLDQLLSRVTKKSRHGEIDTGSKQGREFW